LRNFVEIEPPDPSDFEAGQIPALQKSINGDSMDVEVFGKFKDGQDSTISHYSAPLVAVS
jgi:hypothetical protein